MTIIILNTHFTYIGIKLALLVDTSHVHNNLRLESLMKSLFNPSSRWITPLMALSLSLSVGCGDDTNDAVDPISAGDEAGAEAGAEAGVEAGAEAGVEAGVEAGAEAAEFELVISELEHEAEPSVSDEDFVDHVSANQAFTFELHANGSPPNVENVMTSAWSVRQAFTILYPGARGDTQDAIAETLGFHPDLETSLSATNRLNDELSARQLPADEAEELAPVIIKTANAVWAQDGLNILSDFLDLARVHLDAGVHILDFFNAPEQSRLTINKWVEEQTVGRIKDLLAPINVTSDTLLVLTNAVYFKAPWYTPFEEENTLDKTFTIGSGAEVMTPTLHNTSYAPAAIVDGVQVLTLPFRGNKLAMTFLMPLESEISELESSLTPELWSDYLEAQVGQERPVSLPKFKFETEAPLNNFFKERATQILYQNPDLSQIVEGAPLQVTGVFHKSFIEVAEGGAEAAAATAIVAGITSVPEYGPAVDLDRPFLFAIHDQETGAILFFGRLNDPTL